MRKSKKLLAAGMAAAASLTAAAVIVPATSASAATGVFTLCSDGGYGSVAQFPDRGYLETVVIDPGRCTSLVLGGDTNEQVNVIDADTDQLIGSTIYNGSVGETIVTIAGPSFYAYNG